MDDYRNDETIAAIEAAMVTIRRRQTRRSLARAAGAADDTVAQVLDVVEGSARPVGVTDVAAALGVDQPRASKLVAAAVAEGLLRREADQADGRRSRLLLTAVGRARVDAVSRFRRQRFAAAVATWTDADRATFAQLLTRFVAGLDQGGQA